MLDLFSSFVNVVLGFIIFIIFVAFFYYFYRFKFEFNYKFFIALSPYLVFSAILGTVSQKIVGLIFGYFNIAWTIGFLDLGFLSNLVLVFALTMGLFIMGLILSDSFRIISYRKTGFFGLLVIGLLFGYNFIFYNFMGINNFILFGLFLFAVLVLSIGFVLFFDKISSYKILKDKLNFFLIFGQFLDASSSLSLVFLNSSGFNRVFLEFGVNPFMWFFAKLIFAVLICWVLDKYTFENSNKKNFSKFSKLVIASIGLVIGFKSLILLSA